MAQRSRDPFRILLACLLSLRTKDAVTAQASARLFRLGRTPRALLSVPRHRLARAIYPVGFYRTKAAAIHAICRQLLARHRGRVPDTLEGLLTLPGVGRKTANLVLIEGFRKAGICVDTHVHRISNRLGYVRTKTPEDTEMALRATLPARHWARYNELLVSFGQTVCHPTSPWCSRCPVAAYCARRGVTYSR
ncbi:MAG: endonuclease III [Candidatus Omnitrophica bacterium]|nr:endonuclease III [Candidatus Omnitrophota bacterium]